MKNEKEESLNLIVYRYPFECDTPMKFIGCHLIQSFAFLIGATIFTTGVLLTVSLCEYLTIFVSDIEVSLRKLNKKIIKNAKKSRMQISDSMCIEVEQELSKIVKFYSEARQLSVENVALIFTFQN